MRYVVYISTGEIIKTGDCPDGMLEEQKGPGEFVIEGEANDITQKIVDGKVVDK
jgi:hypothetical protein